MTTQARELAKIVTNAGDVNLGDDISLASDGAILNFGADSDVTLTHVADTGLLLNSSRQIQFGDSGTYIRQSADAVLQLTSDTEVEINATTVDINANVDISGNLVLGGNITIGDADSDDISFGGELTSHIVPNADDTYDLGSSTKQWRNLYVDGSAYIDTIDGTDETTITNTDTGSSAGPIVSLYRNSSSAADADYLGQFKFQGENDADQQVNYAKITGKILDASDGSEDGILEFAHIKAGSQTITGRWRSDSLQLLNGTTLVADGGVQIDDITIDGTEIDLSSGDLTLDVAGEIRLSADDNGEVHFYDGSLHYGSILEENSNLIIQSIVQDEDIIFKGDDGGSVITALTLDMSKAGEATFNDDINLGDSKRLRMGAGEDFEIFHDGSHNYIKGASGDQDIIFQGVDGSSAITAMTIDMSAAGAVGIGQTSPSAKLDVVTNDNVYVAEFTQSNTSNGDGVIVQVGSTAAADYAFNVRSDAGNTQIIAAKADGKVGIGQASPSSALHITGSGDTKIIIEDGSDEQSITAHSGGLNYGVVSGDSHTFVVGGTDAAFIDSGSTRIKQTAITSSSNSVAWDAKAAANAYHITTENTTFAAPSNAVEGAIISVELAQGGTARTIAWNTVFEFAASTAPTVTATANKTDIFTFRYNGSVWQEIGRVQNMAQT